MRYPELSRERIPSADGLSRSLPRIAHVSLCDVLMVLYYAVLLGLAYVGVGAARRSCLLALTALLAVHVTTVMIVRSRDVVSPIAAIVYRVVLYGGVQASYFVLRPLLAMAVTREYDARLQQLDVSLFGVEPTIWLDRFVSPFSTEWFSFFYFGYFVLLAVHVYPMVFFSRRRGLLAEFMLAMFLVFCVAHCLYAVVPGYGPHRYLAAYFQHALPHGRFYDLVLRTVAAGGAQKDIFPSLHTAGPTAIALFSFRHRDLKPFRYTWPLVAFFTANIVIATVFLRWHYVVDVLAGLALALAATWLAARIARWEEARRERLGFSDAWPEIHARR